jgi:tripartite-type tricarboxylate transporter receptor subunit TctC
MHAAPAGAPPAAKPTTSVTNLGRTVVVENRAGAGGNPAHQVVSKAAPDGSVILLGSIGPLAIAPHLMNVGYDVQKDLAPLTMGVTFPNVLVVNPTVGVKTLAEFVAKAKAKPGSIDYASTGNGSASHLAGELLNQRAGIDTVHIPYKGGAPALQDLLGGRVAAYYSTPSTAAPHIEAGKLIPLATTGLIRSPFMPNVPSIAESGYPASTPPTGMPSSRRAGRRCRCWNAGTPSWSRR